MSYRDFIFFPRQDSVGGDLVYSPQNLEDMINKCIENPNCLGFNSLGYFKHSVSKPLVQPAIFGTSDGLCIHKQRYQESKK